MIDDRVIRPQSPLHGGAYAGNMFGGSAKH
jgi:hypothetical protein